MHYEHTGEFPIPKDPFARIIGQDHVVEIARIAVLQRRHLLMVGPPGTGKSLIAQTIATLLPPPNQQISVLYNEEDPERPILEIKTRAEVEMERGRRKRARILDPRDVPYYVSERLGFRCRKCGSISDPDSNICLYCGSEKYKVKNDIDDLLVDLPRITRDEKVVLTRRNSNGDEEEIIYERFGSKVKMYKRIQEEDEFSRKVIVPLDRKTFVQATGASESELLGDVKHDPYGGHPEIGIPPHERVVAGAIHMAHEGVLFIDELSTLGDLQRYILTAMQDKKFPIQGRNSTSTGAIIRVDDVPCDFIFVGAVNINDLQSLLPPLRSRIAGSGYEVLLNTVMEDNERNREKIVQFIAQEIAKDGRIPHATMDACEEIILEAKRRARLIDEKDGLTLRLRDLSGIIRMAGDIARVEGAEFIERGHVRKAIKRARTVEEQLIEKYGSMWKAGMSDYGSLARRHVPSEVR